MRTLLLIIVCVVLSIAGTLFFLKQGGDNTAASTKETAYERVMRTGTIRCGYAAWPVFMAKNLETGNPEGMFVDIVESMATKLHLKVEWVEDVGWAGFIEALKTDRIDMFCVAAWPSAERGKEVRFSVPVSYSAINIYVRTNDDRFDSDENLLNDPAVTLATMDGEMSSLIAKNLFPNAKTLALTGMLADPAQLLANVDMGKADAAFVETSLSKGYTQHNPGKIRPLTEKPFTVFPNAFPIAFEEEKLMTVLNTALIEMLNSGEIDRIIERYEPDRSVFMPVSKPYAYIEPEALP